MRVSTVDDCVGPRSVVGMGANILEGTDSVVSAVDVPLPSGVAGCLVV